MSRHSELIGLVRRRFPVPSPTAESCLACLAAVPPEEIPDAPAAEELARSFVRAFLRGRPDGLPPALASHVEDWLDFPDDTGPLVRAWASSCSVAEVAHRLRTDPDHVLYLADGLRKRGVELPATPGVKWSR